MRFKKLLLTHHPHKAQRKDGFFTDGYVRVSCVCVGDAPCVTHSPRPEHCRLARHFSLTAKTTEPSERNTMSVSVRACVCACAPPLSGIPCRSSCQAEEEQGGRSRGGRGEEPGRRAARVENNSPSFLPSFFFSSPPLSQIFPVLISFPPLV